MKGTVLFSVIHNCISAAEILLALLGIKRIVYLEAPLSCRKSVITYLAAFFLTVFAGQIVFQASESMAVLSALIFFCVHIFLTRKKRRLAGTGLLFPAMGYLTGLLALFYGVPYTFGNYPENSSWIYVADGIFWMGAAAVYCGREKIKQSFRLDAPYRKLGPWERRFLHICGLFLLVIGFMMIGVKETGMEEGASRIFTGFGCFAVILLEISAVILIHQENQKDYFQYMTTVGEHYLKTELNHFRAYQEREEKMRSFRHDINNHLLCLKELAGHGDLERAKAYILELQTILGESRQDFYTGNEIADAILNEKNILARAGNIEITLEGKIQDSSGIRATDICTLFANALDNALEYLNRQEKGPKWISVEIRQQGKMLTLVFQNPVHEEAIFSPGITAKEEKDEHGLGILNMTYAAKKYKGSLHREIRKKHDITVYSLEILIFLPEASVS